MLHFALSSVVRYDVLSGEERSDKDKIQFGLHFIISVALIYLTVVPAREPVVGAIIAMMEKIQDW